MICKTLLVVIGATLTLSCGRPGRVYAMPEQRSLELGPDPGGLAAFVRMDDPIADDHIVKDISPGRDFRRWAFAAPELRFAVKDARNLKFTAEFAIPNDTYKVTGPVTVSCSINGRKLETLRCDHPGDYHVLTPVPEGWVEAGATIRVTLNAAPRWISPEDGAQLSFLLRSAGFTQ